MDAIQWRWKIEAIFEPYSRSNPSAPREEVVLPLGSAPFPAIDTWLAGSENKKNYILDNIDSLDGFKRSTVDDVSELYSLISEGSDPLDDDAVWTVPDEILKKGLQALRDTLVTDVLPRYFVDEKTFQPPGPDAKYNAVLRNANLLRVVEDYNEWVTNVIKTKTFETMPDLKFDLLTVPSQSPATSAEVSNLLKCLAKMVAARSMWPLAQLKNHAAVLGNPSLDADEFRYKMGIRGLFDYSERVKGSENDQDCMKICVSWLKGESDLPAKELLMMARFLRNDILNSKRPRSSCRVEHDSPFSDFGKWIYLTFYRAAFFIKSPKLEESPNSLGIRVKADEAFFQEETRLTARPCPFCFRPTNPDSHFFSIFGREYIDRNWDIWLNACKEVVEQSHEKPDFSGIGYPQVFEGNIGNTSQFFYTQEDEEDDDEPEEEPDPVDIRNDFHQNHMYNDEGCDYIRQQFPAMLTHISARPPDEAQLEDFAKYQNDIDDKFAI
jgi:hypothetical protein